MGRTANRPLLGKTAAALGAHERAMNTQAEPKKMLQRFAANERVDTLIQERREFWKQNRPGSAWIEKIDCSNHASQIVIA